MNMILQGLRKSSSNKSRGERILDEMESSGIIVNDSVIVSRDGTDNFTSIGAAIDSAPNNTKPEDGYFVIYLRKGHYKEYVVVPKYKKNIMLLGDGINKTVITGKHNFVDGWTTFNSSTFGK